MNQYGAFGDPMVLPGGNPAKPDVPEAVVLPPPSVEPAPQKPLDPMRLEIQPDHEIGGRELICEARKTNLWLYDAFTELVRKIYRDNLDKLIGTPTRKWGRTPQHDGIWIDTELNWKPAHPDFTPAIFVKLSQVQYGSPLGNVNVESDLDLENAVYSYQRVGTGQVTFMHVALTSGEAVALCDNTRYYLCDFCSQIADDLCFTKFAEAATQPLSEAPKESKEMYFSSTTFSFEYYEGWSVKKESPILRSIDILPRGDMYGILSLHGKGNDLHPERDT